MSGAMLTVKVKVDKDLIRNGLTDEFWAKGTSEQCVEKVSVTSPFDSTTPSVVAQATSDNSSSCAFKNRKVTFSFYSDSSTTIRIGWASFQETYGAWHWHYVTHSATYYPSSDAYGYGITVTPEPEKDRYILTIESIPPQ